MVHAFALAVLASASPASCPPMAAAKLAVAPRSTDQLMQHFRAAHDHRDLAAMGDLFCFDPAAPAMPLGTTALLKADFTRAIVRLSMQPVGNGQKFEYVQDGVTYRPTLPPIGWLKIEFEHGPGAKPESTSMLVGVSGGVYYLLSGAAVRR